MLEAPALSVKDANTVIPRQISRVATPLKPYEWEEALEGHPDHRFRDYIRGISQGFRIGLNRQSGSAREHV